MKKQILSVFILLSLFFVFPHNSNAAGHNQVCGSNTDCTDSLYPYCVALFGNPQTQCHSSEEVAQNGIGQREKLYPIPQTASAQYWTNGVIPDSMVAMTLQLVGTNGGVAQSASVMQALYMNPPSSTYYAYKDMQKNLGFPVKDAYAQSYGFEALNPILPIWKAMRNIALVGFVIIFVVIGLMIMLRKNIDQRTVVNVQLALPKIIIALILVVFSYAISGLLVDFITLLTKTGIVALQSTGVLAQAADKTNNVDKLASANLFNLFAPLYDTANLSSAIQYLTVYSSDSSGIGGLFRYISAFFSFQVDRVSLFQFVLYIAIFIAFIRSLFMLLTSYLYVVLNIIFSPFYFLTSAIPGNSASFSEWIKSMMKHMLVFPLVLFMLCFAAIFNATSNGPLWKGQPDNIYQVGPINGGSAYGVFSGSTSMWGPPGLGYWGPAVGPLLSLGLLLTIPRAAGMVQSAFDRKSPSQAASGAAQETIQNAMSRIPALRGFAK